ncbi:MAG: hypothetical protein WCO11_10940 [Sphingomonadales bacterium]|jgi:putative effector of murein hydrolase
MADRFESPVDVEAAGAGLPGIAQMAVAVIVAVAVLLLLNAHALAAWADTLTPGARSARIGAAAHAVADAARSLDGPRAALHEEWIRLKAARWPGQSAPDPAPAA